MTAGIAILMVSIANLITVLYAMALQKKLDKTEDRLYRLERRVG
jgi:hypothetical protein